MLLFLVQQEGWVVVLFTSDIRCKIHLASIFKEDRFGAGKVILQKIIHRFLLILNYYCYRGWVPKYPKISEIPIAHKLKENGIDECRKVGFSIISSLHITAIVLFTFFFAELLLKILCNTADRNF